MKNIYLLPTKNKSNLYQGNLGQPLTAIHASANLRKPLGLYITSGKKAEKGDYAVATEGIWINSVTKITGQPVADVWKKIILTNDQKLIKGGVQAIDDDFIEWFIENESCEFVEYRENYNRGNGKYYYNAIIPKEELKKLTRILLNVSDSVKKQEDYLFTTTDGVEIYIGDKYYYITQDNKNCFENNYALKKYVRENDITFSTRQKGNDYLKTIKPNNQTMQEASMDYLCKVTDCKRTTEYADEDFREGYIFREQQEINMAQGYLNANLENFEKMKTLFDIKDVEIIAEHFYYKGIKKVKNPQVKFSFDEFIRTFKKNNNL